MAAAAFEIYKDGFDDAFSAPPGSPRLSPQAHDDRPPNASPEQEVPQSLVPVWRRRIVRDQPPDYLP
jgi:hypothetical protein